MPKLLSIKNFRGIVTIGDSKDIPPEHVREQQDLTNTLLDAISTRPGTTKFNTTAFSGGLLGLFQYRKKNGQLAVLSATTNGDIISGSSE